MVDSISRLILYSDLPEDSILVRLRAIYADWETGQDTKSHLVHRIYAEAKRILDLSTAYGFSRNLWQNYLTFLMITHENSFSLTCERQRHQDGSILLIAENDCDVFHTLFHFDFAPMEKDLGITVFSTLCHYQSIQKRQQLYNREVSEIVCALSEKLDRAPDAKVMLELLTQHLEQYGVGLFGLNRAFRIQTREHGFVLQEINNMDQVTLDDLIGYQEQKAALRANIEAFVAGRPFNNTLLYGDAGTGKSTSVKAVLNEYWEKGLRVIEINKYQFSLLSAVISQVKNRNYRFILFLDDLSFEENEVEYKFLKAVIEGGLETRPDNVMILATSNRRHLVKESWDDRQDMEHTKDVHRSDTMQEKLSLAARFGCTILYSAPSPQLFKEIVCGLAARHPELHLSRDELLMEANRYELRHGGFSGRVAQQFLNQILGKKTDSTDCP